VAPTGEVGRPRDAAQPEPRTQTRGRSHPDLELNRACKVVMGSRSESTFNWMRDPTVGANLGSHRALGERPQR